ncbi:hypothetical protein RV134_370052 [Roseovarius sp. EC-HK134]|nr:hypothetical protein RV134_370052 [Roseovarius sp. EC-HK134]
MAPPAAIIGTVKSLTILGSGDFKPVETVGAEQHEMDHRGQKEQERALRHENAAGVENEPDLVELCHVYPLSLKPREPDEGCNVCNHCKCREQPKATHVHRMQLLGLLVGETCERQVRFISHELSSGTLC